jgi:ankyrin repeat protein
MPFKELTMRLPIITILLLVNTACSLDSPELPQVENPNLTTVTTPTAEIESLSDHLKVEPVNTENAHQIVAENQIHQIHSDLASGQSKKYQTRDSLGRIPLHYAVSNEAVNALSKMNVVTGTKKNGRWNVAITTPALFVTDHFGQTPYHVMAANGQYKALGAVMKQLCGWWNRHDLNARDQAGRTIVHLAVISQNKLAVDQIIKCQYVDLDALDLELKSALHYAVNESDFSIGWTLLNYDRFSLSGHNLVTLNLKDKRGYTPYDYAVQNGNLIAQEFLKASPIKANFDRQ